MVRPGSAISRRLQLWRFCRWWFWSLSFPTPYSIADLPRFWLSCCSVAATASCITGNKQTMSRVHWFELSFWLCRTQHHISYPADQVITSRSYRRQLSVSLVSGPHCGSSVADHLNICLTMPFAILCTLAAHWPHPIKNSFNMDHHWWRGQAPLNLFLLSKHNLNRKL